MILLQIASELNSAILKMENYESPTPKIAILLKLIVWAQEKLDKKKVRYPKMTDFENATLDGSKIFE